HTVVLEPDGRSFQARIVLIATGARPFVPDVPGANHAITSNEAFHLERLPSSVAIVGGAYIAVEFASIFNGLGVETRLLYRGPKILRGFDEDLRDGLAEEMEKRGIAVRVNADIARMEANGSEVRATLKDGNTLTAGRIMYATGRIPNTQGLGLEQAGVTLGDNGEIVVDEESRSSVAHIYAVGDVTDRVNLTPVAIREGHAFADTVFGNGRTVVDHDLVPTAVFATPEIGTVGLGEAAARAKYGAVDIYKTRFRPLKATLSGREERMTMKLVVESKSEKVLGVHILGADAAEIVQMAAIALKLGATKADFDATMALHPSAAEELVTLSRRQ
ncbi:MAG: FAD-dependent oxidoreductase, partial [Hyphomicrobiaceae bacterium]